MWLRQRRSWDNPAKRRKDWCFIALRNPSALLAVFAYAGVLCLAPAGRTCIAHGLPSTPDTFSLVTLGASANASLHPPAIHIESWNATSVVYINSINFGQATYAVAQVLWSPNL